jgi:histone H3/H4
MTELIVKSKIKSAVPEMSVSGDVAEKLNSRVKEILDKAAVRAKANGRRTLQAKDL